MFIFTLKRFLKIKTDLEQALADKKHNLWFASKAYI